jgi:hypothetical protein
MHYLQLIKLQHEKLKLYLIWPNLFNITWCIVHGWLVPVTIMTLSAWSTWHKSSVLALLIRSLLEYSSTYKTSRSSKNNMIFSFCFWSFLNKCLIILKRQRKNPLFFLNADNVDSCNNGNDASLWRKLILIYISHVQEPILRCCHMIRLSVQFPNDSTSTTQATKSMAKSSHSLTLVDFGYPL